MLTANPTISQLAIDTLSLKPQKLIKELKKSKRSTIPLPEGTEFKVSKKAETFAQHPN